MTPQPATRARSGYINLLKPPGITSQQAVARARRIMGAAKAGHAGTLDPAAAGVLVISLGRATRLTRYIAAATKDYRAEITFGVTTDTLDAEGRAIASSSADGLRPDRVRAALGRFRGRITQTAPVYSALRRGGDRLYRLARTGETVEPPTRWVTIERLKLLRFWPDSHPRALIDVTCSSGTYLRSLAADVGGAVGAPAYLSFLVRTRVGGFRLPESVTLDELAALVDAGDAASAIAPPDVPLTSMPRIVLTADQAAAARRGQAVPVPPEQMPRTPGSEPAALDEIAVYNESGGFLGIARIQCSPAVAMLHPRLVLADED